jgi:hypothetical protein
MGIFDRDYMKRRDDGSSGPDVGRARRVLWIGLAVLVLIVVIASLVPPPRVRPLALRGAQARVSRRERNA